MAASSQSSNGMISGINVTPLVDIMLVLLIIFLVTAKISMSPPTAIPLELPRSATGEGIQVVFSITLGRDGETQVNGQPVASDDAILPLATEVHREHPDVRAVIQADGKVLHERVIHVLDLLSRAGIGQIAFGVTLTPAEAKATP
ncbi:MAG TPA: biopolymer transporter ExbD [Myxococcales bacterium]|nr:biopolymer transporter ExbD [Myxococcales bacterium]